MKLHGTTQGTSWCHLTKIVKPMKLHGTTPGTSWWHLTKIISGMIIWEGDIKVEAMFATSRFGICGLILLNTGKLTRYKRNRVRQFDSAFAKLRVVVHGRS